MARRKYPSELNTRQIRVSLGDYALLAEISQRVGVTFAEALHRVTVRGNMAKHRSPSELNTRTVRVNIGDWHLLMEISRKAGITFAEALHLMIEQQGQQEQVTRVSPAQIPNIKDYLPIRVRLALIPNIKGYLPIRVRLALERAYGQGYLTKPLNELTDMELLRVRQIGPKALVAIRHSLY